MANEEKVMEVKEVSEEMAKAMAETLDCTKKIIDGKAHHPTENAISEEHEKIVLRLSEMVGTTSVDMLETIIMDYVFDIIKQWKDLKELLDKKSSNEKENKA